MQNRRVMFYRSKTLANYQLFNCMNFNLTTKKLIVWKINAIISQPYKTLVTPIHNWCLWTWSTSLLTNSDSETCWMTGTKSSITSTHTGHSCSKKMPYNLVHDFTSIPPSYLYYPISMARNGLSCDVPLRNYPLTHCACPSDICSKCSG